MTKKIIFFHLFLILFISLIRLIDFTQSSITNPLFARIFLYESMCKFSKPEEKSIFLELHTIDLYEELFFFNNYLGKSF